MSKRVDDFIKQVREIPVPGRGSTLVDRMIYRDTIRQIEQVDFKHFLAVEHGVEGNPKLDKVFELAWDYGSSNGLEEVAIFFAEMVELIQ